MLLIYSSLPLYMSCWWLLFRNSGDSIGPGVNERARRENEFLSLLFSRFLFSPLFFVLFRFIYVTFHGITAIHLNQCYSKETDSKKGVLMLISFMFLLGWDWQQKERIIVWLFGRSAWSLSVAIQWNYVSFVWSDDQSQITWNLVVWMPIVLDNSLLLWTMFKWTRHICFIGWYIQKCYREFPPFRRIHISKWTFCVWFGL